MKQINNFMLFSSTVFIFLFLPIVLGVHFLLEKKFRNLFILIASLFFYAWGEYVLVLLMMSSICLNYIIGNLISNSIDNKKNITSKVFLYIGVIFNLSLLGYYKYIHFIIDNLSEFGINFDIDVSNVTLPIGISFFTFQSISYLIDVYRKTVKGQRNIINLGMYISLFPQLIAGPIVRYADIAKEIEDRTITSDLFKLGIKRFIIGFAKKVIIANNVGLIADKVFAIPVNDLSTSLTWIGVLCYTLQIYYDFSGYSDMAIGLGKMFGFNFKENFNHPYISKSVADFWRRWHISLSSWFKDYLYIPLGGNRKGKYRTYVNLLIVFSVTGLWHGASWSFVVWGLFHGFFIIIEKINPFKLSTKFDIFRRVYLLIVVMIGWVLFRADNLEYALLFVKNMFSFVEGCNSYPYLYLNTYVVFIIILGIIFATPLRKTIEEKLNLVFRNRSWAITLEHSFYLVIFIISIMELAQATYNPFIYFRF